MTSSFKACCFSALFLAVTSVSVAAQGEATVRAGEQIRLELVGPTTAPVGVQCAGQVREVSFDTLVVASSGNCPGGSYIADLRVIRGHHGSRLTHVVLGGLAGGVAGAIAARLNTGDCAPTGCVGDDARYVSGIQSMVYTASGALVGGFAGLVLPAGPRWVRAGVARPLRVLGLDAHPSLHVSVARRKQR